MTPPPPPEVAQPPEVEEPATNGVDSDLDAVPQCLRDCDQWVVWRYENRDGKQTKIPINARTGARADTTDASTWCSFDDAVNSWRANGHAGVGFVFSKDDPFCGIDLDDCVDVASGEIKLWGLKLIQQLDSYAEFSPSGGGVKVFVRASKPGERCRKAFEDGEVEIYDCDRFFTVTGRRIPEVSAEVEQRQAEVAELYRTVFGEHARPSDSPAAVPTPAPPRFVSEELTDERIIELAKRSRKSGAKFTALWNGEWTSYFGSQSEADASVVCTLAFYTKDPARLDRLFRGSALMRGKWDERHGEKTYGQITIESALSKVTAQFLPRPILNPAMSAATSPASVADALVQLGERDPESGCIVLAPRQTLPTALAFVKEFYTRCGRRALVHYAGAPMMWRGNRYVEVEEAAIRQQLQPWLHDALRYEIDKRTHTPVLVAFESNPSTINAAAESIWNLTHLSATTTPPCWLPPESQNADQEGRETQRPGATDLLAYPSGTLDLLTGKTLAPTPALFNINAIDFEYDPEAPIPERWIKFLEQLWDDDLESVELLQEWFGYCLVADTSLQKMLLMVGPKRSGKGTIGRVLNRLVGSGNVVGPTTSSLAGPFGLQPLIGKSLATVSDARFGGDSVGVVVERLLCISGEDALTVDRKFMGSVTMRLPTRFMFLTNELPRMNDASGALAGRFVVLRMAKSFYGQEDTMLTQQLMAELPGILLWAIDGLKRLRRRGHFLQPSTVAEAVREMEDLASPVLAFVRERCVVGPGHRVWLDDLYAAWKSWCERDGRTTVTLKQTFGRDLSAAVPGVVRRRGHFLQPSAVADAIREMEDLASPVLAFVRDCCEVAPGKRAWVDDMYEAWKRWCDSDGRSTVTTKQVFGRDLAAAVPGVVCRRHRMQGRFYDGVALRGALSAPDDLSG